MDILQVAEWTVDFGDAEHTGWLPTGAATPKLRRGIGLYDDACKGGDANACYSLAGKYDSGVGVPKDAARAAALYKQACEAGESVACIALERSSR